jgi:hypothetical protein
MNKKKVILIIPHIGSKSAECIATNFCKSLSDYEKIVLIFEEVIRQDVEANIILNNENIIYKCFIYLG